MKYLLVLLLFTTFLLSQSDKNKVYSITYLNEFKDRLSADFLLKEYTRLMVNGNSSIYQIYNVMIMDTLRKDKKVTDNDFNKYFSFNTHRIEIKDNNVSYRETIFEDEYIYDETLNYKWVPHEESKLIENYNCKKATTSYGGRIWVAWYAVDLPINAGPHKFKGLPGLIIKLTDATNSYNFTFAAIVEKSMRPLEKYYHKKPESEWIKTDRTTFNKIKANFESMSLNEKLNYGNTGPKIQAVMVGGSGGLDNELRDPNKISKAKDINLIEIDYKD
jgi:GLPGLI family protein